MKDKFWELKQKDINENKGEEYDHDLKDSIEGFKKSMDEYLQNFVFL